MIRAANPSAAGHSLKATGVLLVARSQAIAGRCLPFLSWILCSTSSRQ